MGSLLPMLLGFLWSGERTVFHQPQNMTQQHSSPLQILPLNLTDPFRKGLCTFLSWYPSTRALELECCKTEVLLCLSHFFCFITNRWHLTVWYVILLLDRCGLKLHSLLSLVFTLIGKEVLCIVVWGAKLRVLMFSRFLWVLGRGG